MRVKNTGKVLLLAILTITRLPTHAQTWDEWFRQSKTQKKYLAEQIVALNVYLDYAGKGYRIVQNGLATIRDIKNDEFGLHSTFFKSLQQIKPAIAAYSRVSVIVNAHLKILRSSKSALANLSETDTFTPEEISYCHQVYAALLSDCLHNIEVLYEVLRSSSSSMKDNERIAEIDRLYLDMESKLSFCIHFTGDCEALAIQRLKEQMEINRMGTLNGLQ